MVCRVSWLSPVFVLFFPAWLSYWWRKESWLLCECSSFSFCWLFSYLWLWHCSIYLFLKSLLSQVHSRSNHILSLQIMNIWSQWRFCVRSELAAALNEFSNRWCKRENVEPDALKEWKINIFEIIDTHFSFYSRNTYLLPPKPKSSFRHLIWGIKDFHMNYALVPADKAANNVVVVWRLYYTNTFKR